MLLRNREFLKLGVVLMRLFSITDSSKSSDGSNNNSFDEEGQRDCLSELVKEDYEIQYFETKHLEGLNDFLSVCVVEKALSHGVSFEKHQHHRDALESIAKELRERKDRIIFRGDNIASFGLFFEENLPYLHRIESFLDRLSALRLNSADDMSEDERRVLGEIKKHIENWLHSSFLQNYAAFADFLLPIHFALILIKMLLTQVLTEKTASSTATGTSPPLSLLCSSAEERVDEFTEVIWSKKNVYELCEASSVLKNISSNPQAM